MSDREKDVEILALRHQITRRVHGELLALGVKVAPSTVCKIPKVAGIDLAPERAAGTWAGFLRSQADAMLACDFLETVTLTGARM